MATVTGTGNRCTLRRDSGESTDYWAPQGGGYVHRDVDGSPGSPPRTGCLGPQVCDALGVTEPTLSWSGQGDLANVIRREWQRLLARRRASEVSDDPTDAEWDRLEAEQRSCGIR